MQRLLNVFYPGGSRFEQAFPAALLTELQQMVEYRVLPERPANWEASAECREELYAAEILLTGWGTPMLPEDLAQNGRLKYICHVTGAVRSQIPRSLLDQGVLVTNWGTSISRTIAEAALMMILASLRRVRPIQEELHNRRGYHRVPLPHSLFERRVGLLGFGSIARELVLLLQPFHPHILAYDPYVPGSFFADLGVERVPDIPTLFKNSDIISVHAAKTDETDGVVNREMLQLLPDDGILVNTARGSLINEEDLATELRSGRLWASLDVYRAEPLPSDSALRGLERLLLFPHQAGPTIDRYIDMGRLAVDNIRRYLNGEAVQYQVGTKQYDIMT